MNKNELIMKRAKAWEDAKNFLDSHRNEEGILSVEDDAAYAEMEKKISDYSKEIARMDRQEEMEKALAKPTSEPITEKPAMAKNVEEKTGRASEAYKKNFWNKIRGLDNYEIRNVLTEGVQADGGYLVPDEFEHTLVEGLTNEAVIRKLAHVITTSSGSHAIPVVATRATASWVGESGSYAGGEPSFGQKILSAHKVTCKVLVSEELLRDSAFNLENYFETEFTRAINEKEEAAFITGDGTNKPTGILVGNDGAEVGVTAASTTTITTDECIDLFYSLKAPYRKNAVWIMNDATVKLIRKLKDSNGQYLWQKALNEGDYDTFLGKKIITCDAIPTIAAGAKVILFGDFSYLWIGDRTGIEFKRLDELHAENGQVEFLASKRVDSVLTLPEAIKVLQMKASTN